MCCAQVKGIEGAPPRKNERLQEGEKLLSAVLVTSFRRDGLPTTHPASSPGISAAG